jgi:hypothetical protein
VLTIITRKSRLAVDVETGAGIREKVETVEGLNVGRNSRIFMRTWSGAPLLVGGGGMVGLEARQAHGFI